MFASLRQDLLMGCRLFFKKPGSTMIALFSLAVGIGANTAIFTLVKAVFLNPLPVREASQLAEIFTVDTHTVATAANLSMTPTSLPNYLDYRSRNTAFSGLAASVIPLPLTWSGRAQPEKIPASLVTANYFDVLGVTAYRGRLFVADEDQKLGGNAVVVLSYSLWMHKFGGDTGAIGSNLSLNGQQYTIIGVTPPGFKGTLSLAAPELVWIPISMRNYVLTEVIKAYAEGRRFRWLNMIGRFKPGSNLDRAETEMKSIAAALEKEYPKENQGRTLRLVLLSKSALGVNQRQRFTAAGAILMSVAGFILLIACANVANLLLAQASGREREIGMRAALGASRMRLVRQLLTESTLLSALGCLVGLLLAYWGRSVLWSFRPPDLQSNAIDLSFDVRVLGFTIAISLATGLLFGIAPALKASNPRLAEVLKLGGRSGSAGSRNRLRGLLVVAEFALALIAITGAGLFIRSMQNAQHADIGIDSKHLLVIGFDLSSQRYDAERGQQFFRTAIERSRAVTGVESAAVATNLPLRGGIQATVFREGEQEDPNHRGTLVTFNTVSPEFFETAGIPLLRGRRLSDLDRENTASVAVVNNAMARLLWPGDGAIGKRFTYFGKTTKYEVVGVVADSVVNAIGEQPQPVAYFPVRQRYADAVFLHVHTGVPPEKVLGVLRQEIQHLDQNLALTDVQTVNQLMDEGLWASRMAAALLGIFGLLALSLASVGIYGVMSYSVAQRRTEIGIRMALGARRLQVLALVFTQGMQLALIGAVLGLVLATAFSRMASSLLYGIGSHDPITFTAVTFLLLVVASLACCIPALRATRVDPLIAMRYE